MDRNGIRMRKLIGLLLALNLGVFLAGMALQRWSPDAPAPALFNADKVRLLASPSPPASKPSQAPESPPEALAEPLPATLTETPPEKLPDPTAVAPLAAKPRCLSWASLDAAAVKAIEARLKQAGVAITAYDIKLEQKLGWWVFLPPLEDAAEAQARMDQVRLLGITDYATVRGGSMRNALSLGAFATLAQARTHSATMTRKGVAAVQFGPRPEAGSARLVFADSIADDALPDPAAAWPIGKQPARCVP